MTTEFERCKEVVCGRSVMITSWYDEAARTWCAGAPAYAHLFSFTSALQFNCGTRQAAVSRLTTVLAGHFTAGRS